MIKTILLGLLALIVLGVGIVLALAAGKPDTFRVERSVVIAAPADAMRPQIDTLRAWTHWSPYEDKDPDMQREFGGPERGVGAWYAWDGDDNVGAGRMEVVESQPQQVRIRLDFLRPFESRDNMATFTLAPEAGGTRVTWAMEGPAPYLHKAMQVVFDMDAMIGNDFTVGLDRLKARVESGAR